MRQFDGSVTRPQAWCDLWFGILLPLLCFALDPGYMNGTSRAWFLSSNALFVQTMCVLSIVALLAWHRFGRRHPVVGTMLAGPLFAGGMVAFAVGVSLLPVTLTAVLIVINLFGLLPFGAAFVLARRAVGAIELGAAGLESMKSGLIAFATGMLTILYAAGYQQAIDGVIERSVRQLPGVESLTADVALVRQWPMLVPRAEFMRMAQARGVGSARFSAYGRAYELLYRESMEAELRRMSD
jgi:hypothetical protein